MSDANKALVRRAFAARSSGLLDGCDEYIAPDYYNHERNAGEARPDASTGLLGPEKFAEPPIWLRGAFAALQFIEEHIVAEGDWVAVHTIMSGQHTGEFFGIPATGRTFEQQQTHWLRIRDGHIVEHLANRDDLGLLRQLGVFPGPDRN